MKVLKLNAISPLADPILKNYEFSDSCTNPDGIMLRSFSMHEYEVGTNLLAVARAGAGVNNIPIPAMTEKGIAVFNTPGANANAVKELVICALLLASRKITDGISWAKTVSGDNFGKQIEKGKSSFVGPEIAGKTLGVIGLGAIGAKVANAANDMNMRVYGEDPYLSVDAAWSLSRKIIHERDRKNLYAESDYITLHVPYLPTTKHMINADAIAQMKDGVRIINCARGELVDNDAMLAALRSGKVACYVTDFPSPELINEPNVVCIPHLGASTAEAEDNCAVMAAQQLDDYLRNGNITNSVNLPNVYAPSTTRHRVSILHRNIPNMISLATSALGAAGINISNLVSATKNDVGYMLLDTDTELDQSIVDSFTETDGFIRVRVVY